MTTETTKMTAEEAIARMRENLAKFDAMTEAEKLAAKRQSANLVRVVEFEGSSRRTR